MSDTITSIKFLSVTTIITALRQEIDAYQARGFKIRHVLGDQKFQHTRKQIEHMGIILNITSLDEHIPERNVYHNHERKSMNDSQYIALEAINQQVDSISSE